MGMFGMGGQQAAPAAAPDPAANWVSFFPPPMSTSSTSSMGADTTPLPTLISPILQQPIGNVVESPSNPGGVKAAVPPSLFPYDNPLKKQGGMGIGV